MLFVVSYFWIHDDKLGMQHSWPTTLLLPIKPQNISLSLSSFHMRRKAGDGILYNILYPVHSISNNNPFAISTAYYALIQSVVRIHVLGISEDTH